MEEREKLTAADVVRAFGLEDDPEFAAVMSGDPEQLRAWKEEHDWHDDSAILSEIRARWRMLPDDVRPYVWPEL